MDGGGACGAAVLDPGRRLEAEMLVRLQRQRSREVLRREAVVVEAHVDGLDIARRHAGAVQPVHRHPEEQRITALDFQLANLRVCRSTMLPGGNECVSPFTSL